MQHSIRGNTVIVIFTNIRGALLNDIDALSMREIID